MKLNLIISVENVVVVVEKGNKCR